MKRLQDPKPNRKGNHEEHLIPDRRVAGLMMKGWTEVFPDADDKLKESAGTGEHMEAKKGPLTESLSKRKRFDLSGPWTAKRAQVRDELEMERVPRNKDEARTLLEDAGYEVTD